MRLRSIDVGNPDVLAIESDRFPIHHAIAALIAVACIIAFQALSQSLAEGALGLM